MLGFGAIGRYSIGEVPHPHVVTMIPANAGTFVYTGQTGNQFWKRVTGAGAYAYTGFAALFGPTLFAQAGAYVLTGIALTLTRLTGISYFNARLIQPALSQLRKTAPTLNVWAGE